MSHSWSLLALILLTAVAVASDLPKGDGREPEKRPPELGRVPFLRDYAKAVEQAKTEKKPLFVLFDEVPG